jgi:UbiD family decarboxylase
MIAGVKRCSSSNTSAEAAHLDFRLFVNALRKDGDLADINVEVDPDLEVAAITRRVYEKRAKAPLFNNVTGARDGLFRILGAQGGLSNDPQYTYHRLARHVGLPPEATLQDVIDRMLSAKKKTGIAPVKVETGPCKEVKIAANDVDLTGLPVPKLNKADGGDYIQTMVSTLSSIPQSHGRIDPSLMPWSTTRIAWPA